MKRSIAVSLLLFAAFFLMAGTAFAQADFAVGKADEFISALEKGDYTKAYNMVDSNLGFNTTPDKWKASWSKLTSQAGNFVEFRKSETSQGNGYTLVTQVCKFEKGLVDLLVAVNDKGQIAGFQFKNHKAS